MNTLKSEVKKKKLKDGKEKFGKDFIGNVIRIIDTRTLIVNAGTDSLNIGDIIQVYEPGEMIKDIDGSDLCIYNHVKDSLEVIQVEELYSICQKMDTETQVISLPLSPLLEREQEYYIPLNVKKEDIEKLTPTEFYIKVGDPIKKLS